MPLALQSAFGILVFLLLVWLFSENRARIPWRTLLTGVVLQFLLAAMLLWLPPFKLLFLGLNELLLALEQATRDGTSFVFGYLGGRSPILKMGPLAMFVMMVDINNQQVYSFIMLVTAGLVMLLGVTIVVIVHRLLSPMHPEKILLRWREHAGRLTRNDQRYNLDRFQAAKAHFLSKHRLQGKGPLILWGAGPSGRLMHDLLLEEGTRARGFLEVHPRRIGGEKRGLPVWPIEEIDRMDDVFILVAVGAAGARENIREFMDQRTLIEGEHFLFVA